MISAKTGWATVLASLVLAATTFVRVYDPVPIVQLRERIFDGYQRIKPRPPSDLPVRIIDIDEASLATWGQWPWPRDRLAMLVDRLNQFGAAAIVFDVIFSEPDRASPHRLAEVLRENNDAAASGLTSKFRDYDREFADAMSRAPVVLGFAATRAAGTPRPAVKAGFATAGVAPQNVLSRFDGATVNIPMLEDAASGVAGLNLSERDKSGIVRRVPMLFSDGKAIYPGLVAEALRVAQRQQGFIVRGSGASGEFAMGNHALVDMRVGALTVPLTRDGEVWVHFDHDRPERYIPIKELLTAEADETLRPRIEGNIVFIGASAAGLYDSWPTALGEFVPGVSVHAQVAEQILDQTFLLRPDWTTGAEIVATIALGLLLTTLLLVFGARWATAIGLLAAGAGAAGSWLAFAHAGLLIDPIYPVLSAFATYFSVVGLLYMASDRERKFVRRAFGQYVAPELLTRLERKPALMRLGGDTRIITLMFMDVRGFTTLSEQLSAPETVHFINQLLSPLSDVIQHEAGTIDKYIGDAIMAFWNAPLDIDDHPRRACRAALEMRSTLAKLNAADAFGFRERGVTHPQVRIGIGINTGDAVVGNMGSERRFNYSAMGDVVNTTSRIESHSKDVGFDIIVSDETASAARDFAFLEAGEFQLKGKSQSHKLFALVGDETVAANRDFVELAAHHAALLRTVAEKRPGDAARELAICRQFGGELLSSFYEHFARRLDAEPASWHRAAE